ncbi:MAG: YggT family protein [Burkholderiaceae bacterium]|nr:MAG: YggT family protein [Burkholderiaceae bacterium]TAM05642.1 MAG: YggT family protein [Pusillimonas sp.]
MLSDTLRLIVNIAFTLFGIALVIRAWAYAVRLHPFNPYSQAVTRITDWLVQPIRKIVPATNRYDFPSLLACWLTAFVFLLVEWLVASGDLPPTAVLLPTVVAGALTVLKWIFTLILWMTLIQAVLSWINPLAPIMPVLRTLTAPLLDPIRRILPTPGGLDFSPLVLLIVAQVVIRMIENLIYSI